MGVDKTHNTVCTMPAYSPRTVRIDEWALGWDRRFSLLPTIGVIMNSKRCVDSKKCQSANRRPQFQHTILNAHRRQSQVRGNLGAGLPTQL